MARPSLPSWAAPIAEKETGNLTQVWRLFFQSLVSSPKAIVSIPVGASPFTYIASDDGSVVISGGTVSDVSLKRGNVTVALPTTAGMFALSQGDSVIITHSGAPTVSFVPR